MNLPDLPWEQGEFPDASEFPDDFFLAGELLAADTSSIPSVADSSNSVSSGISNNSRPGVHERRNDSEPVVYNELASFPSFNTAIPAEASLEEICIQYPNHLRGSYLDAFIQWSWTATDIYTHLSDQAKVELKTNGVSRTKAHGNRANVFMKRLDARLSLLSAEEVTALCLAPKLRSCLLNGGEHYGASKLQGKFHNPSAPAIRSYPQRQGKPRRARASTSVDAIVAKRTFLLDGKERLLWSIPGELEEFKTSMATLWTKQRAYAEAIIDRDTGHRQNDSRRLILQMTNWAVNPSTETFFSFQNIEDCPSFMIAINDMVVAVMTHLLDIPSAGGAVAPMTVFDLDQRLVSARRSAVKYTEEAQKGRLFSLEEFAKSLPAGLLYGVVDRVFAWNGDVVQELARPMEAQPMSQYPSGQNIVMYENSHVPTMSFAEPASWNLNHAPLVDAQPMPRNLFDGSTMSHYPSRLDMVSGNSTSTNANLGPPHESQGSFNEGMPLSHNATTGPNLFSHDSTATNANPAKRKYRFCVQKSVLSKRPREEPVDQVDAPKRVGFVEPMTEQGSGSVDAGLDARALFDPLTNPPTMQPDTGLPTAPGLLAIPENVVIDYWPVGDASNDPAMWPDMLPAEFDWTTVGLDDIPVQQDMPHTSFETLFPGVDPNNPQPDQAFSGADVALTLEPLMGIMREEFAVEEMPGVEGRSNPNFEVSTGAGEVAQDGAYLHAGADTTVPSWDLPDLEDNDEDWLREAIANAMAMGPPEDEGF